MDVQGHLLEYDLNPVFHGEDFYAAFPQQDCGEDDPRVCFSIEHFLEAFFIRSDTNVVVLSALPIYPEGSPLSPEIMAETRRIVEGLCRDERVLLHGQVLPNVGSLGSCSRDGGHGEPLPDPRLEDVHALPRLLRAGRRRVVARRPRARAAGGRRAVHPSQPRARHPDDLRAQGPVAAGAGSPRRSTSARPPHAPRRELRRVPLGLRDGHVRGPVHRGDGGGRRQPADRLARTRGHRTERERVRRARHDVVEPDADPDAGRARARQAAEARRRGQRRVGDRLPVLRLAAAADPGVPRVPRSREEFQERYGYPALTKELKAKVLGRNAARLYGIEPVPPRCDFTRRELARIREELRDGDRLLGPATFAASIDVREHHRMEVSSAT